MQVNQSAQAQNADIPPFMLTFGADASVATAAAQNIPPYGTVTSTTIFGGHYCGRNTSWISRLRVRFTGDVLNIAGQTINFAVLVNGVAIATAVLSAGLATTAGVKTDVVNFTTTQLAEGDIVRVTMTPSAGLTAVVTLINATLS